MCGVRKLTRAAYANQRMPLYGKLRQSKDEAEYGDRATCVIHTWRVSSFMFLQGRLAMPHMRRGCLGTRHSSFLRGSVVLGSAEKEAKSDSIAGARYLNDTPSGCG